MGFYAINDAGTPAVLAAEDVEDVVRNIDLDNTPITSALPSNKIMGLPTVVNEDTLATPDADNAAYQGADAPVASDTTPTQRSVYTQIFTKTAEASRTLRQVKLYGVDDELDYQTAKKLVEIKRDREEAVISTNATQAPAGLTTPGKMAGLGNLISTNVDSTEDSLQQDGTTHFGQVNFNIQMQACREAGGTPGQAYVGGTQKRHISHTWDSNVTRRTGENLTKVQEVVDSYHSDFGVISIDHHYRMTIGFCFILQMDMLSMGYLSQWFTQDLAITGDKRSKQIVGESCLVMKVEKCHAMFDGLTT